MITPAVTRAMTAQLDRVNATAELEQARYEGRLLDRIRELELENQRLKDRLAAYEDQRVAPHPAAPHLVDGRPVITPAQAAHRARVSVATVSRYCTTGYWQAARQPGSNRWWVYADQPLTPKPRK